MIGNAFLKQHTQETAHKHGNHIHKDTQHGKNSFFRVFSYDTPFFYGCKGEKAGFSPFSR